VSVYRSIFQRLARRELLIPYFEHAVLADNWPDSYTVTVDSSPYYGAGDGFFHPSSHAVSSRYVNAGARYLWYLFHPRYAGRLAFERRSVQSEITLAMGSALHSVVQTQFVQAGLLRPENVEFEYVNTEHHVRGRVDFIVDHPNGRMLPVELKTQNAMAFHKQAAPKPEWEAQLSLALDNTGHELGVLLVMEAGFPYRMKEFPVSRNDSLLTQIYTKFDQVRAAIEADEPPGPCCSPGSNEMKSCPARFVCWLSPDRAEHPG
jgi:hypothetical protein